MAKEIRAENISIGDRLSQLKGVGPNTVVDYVPIKCPHWYCSMLFLTERRLFQHYRSAHAKG